MIADVRTMREQRDTTMRRLVREQRLKRALEEYAKYLRIKAFEFERFPHEREDFEQEGREAIWRAVTTLEAKGEKGSHQYFRVAISQAMIDYDRKVHKRNYEVWVYTGPPPRVHKVRYRGKTKTKMQYFGAKLTRVAYRYEPPLNYDKPFAEKDE